MTLRTILIALLIAFSTIKTARGKEVSIEWQASPQAVKYELQIRKKGKVVLVERFGAKENTWRGSLPSGNYNYRIRAIDSRGRAGAWSDPVAFQVVLPPPTPLSPTEGAVVVLRHGEKLELLWNYGSDASQFILTLKGGAAPVRLKVTGNRMEIPRPSSGEYHWTVAPVLEGGAEGKSSPITWFRVEDTREPAAIPEKVAETVPLPPPFRFNFGLGVFLGTDYALPGISGQVTPGKGHVFGVDLVYSNSDAPAGRTASVLGLLLSYSHYFFRRDFSGPFVKVGLGPFFYSASDASTSESLKPSIAGQVSVGWQAMLGYGLSLTAGLGLQYIDTPKTTLVSPRLRGLLPLASFYLGYSF